jgi:hypothetical protein
MRKFRFSRSWLYVSLLLVLGLVTGMLVLLARQVPDWFFGWYRPASQRVLAFLARLNGWAGFAVCEVLLVLIVLWAVGTLIRAIVRRKGIVRWCWGMILFGVFLLCSFTALWGLNHFGPSAADILGLDVTKYTTDELRETTEYFLAQANALSGKVSRDEDGVAVFADFDDLAQEAAAAWDGFAAGNDDFYPTSVRPKSMALSPVMNRIGLTGIFIAWTAEGCISTTDPDVSLPFTMCHELAHRQTVAAEEEANFLSFLVCRQSDSVEFQYSANYTALIHCYNALYKVDKDAAADIWSGLDAAVETDIRAVNAFYKQFETPVKETAQKVNDTYLKAFSEEAGVQSYGQVVDLLIAWYKTQS